MRGEQLAAPDLLRVEVLSVLRRHRSAGLIDDERAARAIDDLFAFPVLVYPTGLLLRRAWELRENVTAYDSCYVALAESLACTLLTADARLAQAPGLSCPVEVP